MGYYGKDAYIYRIRCKIIVTVDDYKEENNLSYLILRNNIN